MPLRFKVQTKEIDCTPYGIDGKLVVRGITGSVQLGIRELYYRLSDGRAITAQDFQDVSNAHTKEITFYTIRECVVSFPGQSDPAEQLTDADIETFPTELIDQVGDAINDLSQFPLTSANGMAQKQEASARSTTASSMARRTQNSKSSK